jgi:hypothetical protein
MPRPKNRAQLIEAAEANFDKLLALVGALPLDVRERSYENDELNDRDRTVADVICHLHEWT